jgi:hypothetical protein
VRGFEYKKGANNALLPTPPTGQPATQRTAAQRTSNR